MKVFIYHLTLIVFILYCNTGCLKKQEYKDFYGQYLGEYGGFTEMLTINRDGTYTQVFRLKGELIYTSNGKWVEYKHNSNKISFRNFIFLLNTKTLLFDDPRKAKQTNASAHIVDGFSKIVFARDFQYILRRQKEANKH